MADAHLLDYLKRSLESGLPSSQAKVLLLQSGWKEADIQPAIDSVYHPDSASRSESGMKYPSMRRLLLIIIFVRLALFPIRFFLAPLQFTPQTYAKYASLPFFGTIGPFGFILPVFWIIPFLAILKNRKFGYVLSILFGFLLIYVNITALIFVIPSQLFIFLSFVYFVSGLAIIGLSIALLRYFPKPQELSPTTVVEVGVSGQRQIKYLTVVAFALTHFVAVFIAGTVFQWSMFSNYGDGLFYLNLIGWAAGALVVALSGLTCGRELADRLGHGRGSSELGLKYGSMNGAVAQFFLYGLNPMLLTVAIPIGAIIGSLLGIIGVPLIGILASKIVLKRS